MREYVFDVTGNGSNCVFLITGDKNILYDTGMAYCGREMVKRVESILDGKNLDGVLLSHSHYDHVAGLPYVKERWPEAVVYGAAHAKDILERPNARKLMMKLDLEAAKAAEVSWEPDFNEEYLKVDQVIGDGDVLEFGDIKVQVLETPGHTKCSLSFFVNEDVLFACETMGSMSEDNLYMPSFLIGYDISIKSIEKMKQLPVKRLLISHYGFLAQDRLEGFFDWVMEKCSDSREKIWKAAQMDLTEEEQIKFLSQYFWREDFAKLQPYPAYALNMASMIKTVVREESEKQK